MFKKLTIAFAVTSILLITFPNQSFAAKKRIKGKLPTTVGYSSVRLRPDRRAIYVNFLNMGKVKQISYSLTYTANRVDQGVGGTITSTGEPSTQRELLFATCSKGVCTYHGNITNMRFIVTTTTKLGRTSTKTYRIKP